MTMVSTGEISIGGNATSGGLNRSINIELGRAASATSSLNESALRTLAGVPSGAISLSNFYGKSNRTFSLAGMSSIYTNVAQFTPGNNFAYYTFYPDGDLLGFDASGGTHNTDWTLPISAGIGSSYWVAWSILSSSLSISFSQIGTSGTWLQLNTARSFGLQSSNNNNVDYGEIEGVFFIASDSSGTNIVATSPAITLSCDTFPF